MTYRFVCRLSSCALPPRTKGSNNNSKNIFLHGLKQFHLPGYLIYDICLTLAMVRIFYHCLFFIVIIILFFRYLLLPKRIRRGKRTGGSSLIDSTAYVVIRFPFCFIAFHTDKLIDINFQGLAEAVVTAKDNLYPRIDDAGQQNRTAVLILT